MNPAKLMNRWMCGLGNNIMNIPSLVDIIDLQHSPYTCVFLFIQLHVARFRLKVILFESCRPDRQTDGQTYAVAPPGFCNGGK